MKTFYFNTFSISFGSKFPSSSCLCKSSNLIPCMTSKGSITFPKDFDIFRPCASLTNECRKTSLIKTILTQKYFKSGANFQADFIYLVYNVILSYLKGIFLVKVAAKKIIRETQKKIMSEEKPEKYFKKVPLSSLCIF